MKRRYMLKNLAGAGLLFGSGKMLFGGVSQSDISKGEAVKPLVPKMKITNVETIATGR